jgi:amino acid adenylation domain-containing protein
MSPAGSETLIYGRQLREERDYWLERLSRDRTRSSLPADHPRPARRPLRSGRIAMEVPEDVSHGLRTLTGNGPFLSYTTLSATLQVCLARYAGSSAILLGSPARKLESVGSTNNVVAILGNIQEQEPFSELLKKTRQVLLDAYARQRYPFHRLLTDLGYGSEQPQCPLFGVVLALRDIHEEAPEVGQEITMTFTCGGERLAGEVAFDPELFAVSTVERFARHYLTLLGSALADPRTLVRDLEMVDAAERSLLAAWSTGPDLPPPPGRPVHQLIAAQACRTPDAAAVLSGSDRLSYSDLNVEANRLAHHLRRLGVAAGSRVAIVMESSPAAMVAILGALKAGAAYVPLDPRQPKDRLEGILASLQPAAVVTVADLLEALPPHAARVVSVDRDREAITRERTSDPVDDLGDAGLAYVIYTSGSTGTPNGVMVQHRALVRRAQAMQKLFDLDGATRQLQFAALHFDVSCEEIFTTWIYGGAVVLLNSAQRQSGLGILAECERLGVTKMNMPASAWHNLVDEAVAAGRSLPASLKISVAGAESPSLEKLRSWNRLASHPLRFFNVYGPTEGTIMATSFAVTLGAGDLDGLSRLPIGRALPDTRILLLDTHLRPVAVGVPGELCIGGSALSLGYFDRPDLSARSFVPDPWSASPGARLYKTGDLARYNAEGLLEFLGRVDFQVKIRGFRIEPGEIEAALRLHPAVRQAVVLVREDSPGDRRLVAYVVAVESRSLDPEELRRHLAGRLPDPMVPSAFVALDELPLTAHGKIDRQALPPPDRSRRLSSFVEPRTPIEAQLAEIWTELLKVERVGATDNFFQLGGHSLLVTQLVSHIHEIFQVELPLQQVFERPTVAELAAQIEATQGAGSGAPPLVPVPRGGLFPLSYDQQRLWFLDQLEPGNPFYNVPSAARLSGRLDVAALEQSLNAIVRRHEALRTTFIAEEGRPMQQIHPELILELPVIDLSREAASRQEARARTVITEAVQRPFDLTRGPLLRAVLVRLADDDHMFLVCSHHIVSDAWSIGVFNHELTELYRAAVEGRQPELPELPVQYADFAHWQRQWLTGELVEQLLAYWRQRLAGATFDLELPTDHPRPATPSFRGAFHRFTLSYPVGVAIERLSRDHGATLFMPLLAAFFALLCRYTGQRDLVVGTPVAGRKRAQTEHLIGFFLNSVVLRLAVTGDPGFLALLEQVRDVALGAFAHHELPFERLVEELGAVRDRGRQPLFRVMFVLQNAALEPLDLPGLSLAPLEVETGTAKFDLTLSLTEGGGRLGGGVEYSSDLFDAVTIGRFAGHFMRLLEGIAADPQRRISDLPLLSAAELQQMFQDWNDTAAELPPQASIHSLFESQAARTPTAEAVICGDETLSYAELNARANRLAHGLRRLGVGSEDRVGICVERSVAMLVAWLGALKAGGAYVPLDPAYPSDRLEFMVDDAGISALVLTPESLLSPGIIPFLRIDAGGHLEEERDLPATDPPANASLQSLAYVMYTSGSTGLPKGVGVCHAGVLRLIWQAGYVALDGRQTLLQAVPMSFDVSTLEVWGALLLGGRCVLAPQEIPTARSLSAVIGRYGIDTLWLTSSLFNAVVDEDPEVLGGVRQLLIGGEALSVSHVQKYRNSFPHTALVNGYGPTESTTFTCCHTIPAAIGSVASIPIGRPIGNTRVYVLDDCLWPVGMGVAGELFIGGLGLARGYLRRPSLTAERFLPDPFSEEAGARLYRTGDVVRWRSPALLEFLGRRDQQVKVRGHRIELGEIEAVLRSHPAIAEAVALAREDQPGQKLLVAYVTAEGDTAPEDVVGFLQTKLPDYMVPRAFAMLPAMPLTGSGKIDRRALQAMDLRLDFTAAYAPPATPTEEMVAGIWSGLVGRERVGRNDDFFALGGHSLLATQVISRVKQAFAIELPVRALFENPRLSSFALHIERTASQSEREPWSELRRAPRDGDLPLSFAQRGLWFLHQLEPESPAFNIPMAVRLTGRLDKEALARSLDHLLLRHEALRTGFPAVGGEPVQRVGEAAGFPLAAADLTALPEHQREAEATRCAEDVARQPFDLSTGPLLRGLLLRPREEDHVLVLTVPHIVADGWSMSILTRELGLLYGAFSRRLPSPLPELPIQYADFAYWQRHWPSEVLEEQLGYWREHLRGTPELVELPLDRPRSELQSFAGAVQSSIWSPELSAALHRLSRGLDVTLFMTLLAAFQVLLYRHSGQTDLCIDSPVTNRTLETEALVGCFLNTVVLRARLKHSPAFRDLLRQVRETALGAYAHQEVPFEMVVEALRPQRSVGYSPLSQVGFTVDRATGEPLELPGLTLSLFDIELSTSKRDLTLTVTDAGDRLRGAFTYRSDLFDAATIRRLAARFEVLLEGLLEQPDGRIDELEILPEAEKQQLVRESEERRNARRALLLDPRWTPSPKDGPPTATESQRLSPQQERLWRLQKSTSEAFRGQCSLLLEGEVEIPALVRALHDVVARHPTLAEPAWQEIDLGDLEPGEQQARLDEIFNRERRQPADLEQGPMLSATLLRLSADRHLLGLTLPALCADAPAMIHLAGEIGRAYASRENGEPLAAEMLFPYLQLAERQRAILAGEHAEQGRAFWRRQQGSSADPRLPFAVDPPRNESFHPEVVTWTMPPDLTGQAHDLATQLGAPLAVVLQAAWRALLWTLLGPSSIVVATAFDGREFAPLHGAMGLFTHWLPIRVPIVPDFRFHELVRRIDRAVSEAREWQSYYAPGGDSLSLPLGFDYQEWPARRVAGKVSISIFDLYLCADRFDLRLSCTRTVGGLALALYYAAERYRGTDIARLAEQLEVLLRCVVASPGARVSEIEIMGDAARHQLLAEWNDAGLAPSRRAESVHLLVEEQTDRIPANLAVIAEDGRMTYAELDARASQLANFLRCRGVGPEVLVALCLDPSLEMVVALLGVLKAGGAYLPLEPGAPLQSLAFILEDAQPKLVLTQARLRAGLPAERPETVSVDDEWPAIARESSVRPASRTLPDHLLYVIYTSGSTGRPKGVPVAHRQMINYVANLCPRLDLPSGASYAMVSTLAADLGCTMLYPALASGGCLHVLAGHRAADPVALAEHFERHAIDALKIVPSHLAALMTHSHPASLLPHRRLVLGGESSRWEWIEQIQKLAPDCVVLNHYGPTETTVGVTTQRLERASGRRGPVPLGRPIANTRIYVLDGRLRPVPVGAPGQLHIGGVALARGYLGRPALTAERFIPDPLGRTPGGRLYATGDLACRMPDGTLEFLGRADHQIKLRGFRIELGEIESVLTEHPGVREAVIVVREEADGDRQLVGYTVSGASGEPAPPASELREFLRERLPEHMVPAAFVPLPALPLTPNGKVDRQALPAPEQAHRDRERALVPPRDDLEVRLVQIWQDLLKVQPIGIHDNFFDLGGHSLLAVALMARIKAVTGKMPPLALLLQQATVADLARVLRQEAGGPQPAMVRMQPRGTWEPFFCVHPAGGRVLSYLELARQMAPDQPFYALQADGGGDGHCRVEDLAGRYLAELLAAQPAGPYFLGGHSFGGVVAYEIARQLQAQGRKVALLVLLDSTSAGPRRQRLRDHDAALMANFALHLGLPLDEEPMPSRKAASLTADEQLAEALQRAKQAGLVPAEMRLEEARRLFELLKSHIEARLSYVPQPYAGRVTLFRAHEQLLVPGVLSRRPLLAKAVRQMVGKMTDPEMGWGRLATRGVEVHELPGNHFSILHPPHVTTLAIELRKCLERARANSGARGS